MTGAASGIGCGMAQTFVAAGIRVVVPNIEAPALEETARSLRDLGAGVHAVVRDVSTQDQVDPAQIRRVARSLQQSRTLPGLRRKLEELGRRLERDHGPILIEQGDDPHRESASLGGLIAGGGTLYGTTKVRRRRAIGRCISRAETGWVQAEDRGAVSGVCRHEDHGFARKPAGGISGRSAPGERIGRRAAARIPRGAAETLKKMGLSAPMVGEKVLVAIREERFYILTHPNFKPADRAANEGNDPMVTPSPELLRKLNPPVASGASGAGDEAR